MVSQTRIFLAQPLQAAPIQIQTQALQAPNPLVASRRHILCLLVFSLLVGLFSAAFAPRAAAADWLYTVRPGDKLWELSDKYCGQHTFWMDLAKHNGLSQPTRLIPGSTLRFPLEWLVEVPAAVNVIYTLGDTRYRSAGVDEERSLIRGNSLAIGDTLITGESSYATIRFADNSVMRIGPDSEVVFDTLSAYKDTGMVDSRVRITRGAGASEVKPQNGPGSVYRISTPLGVAAVRGTEFRTRADGDASFVETTGGAVEYISSTGTTDVTKGLGLKSSSDGVVVEELLAPPVFNAARPYGGHESVEWVGIAGAANYLVQIYSGPDLSEVLSGASVASPEFALASLTPGNYVFGVRGVAASGLQGFEATQALTIQSSLAAPANLRLRKLRRQPNLNVSWQAVDGAADYRVVATPSGGGSPIVETTEDTQLQLQGLTDDSYSVSVQARSGQVEGETTVEETQPRRGFWGAGGVLLAIVLAL